MSLAASWHLTTDRCPPCGTSVRTTRSSDGRGRLDADTRGWSTPCSRSRRSASVCTRIMARWVYRLGQKTMALTSELLRSLHWLPVESRIAFKIAAITYKVLTTGQPNYLRELLNYYTPHCTLRSANQQLLEQPCVSTEFGKRSFSYLGPKTWNNLPREIRLSSTYHTFKMRLKRFL